MNLESKGVITIDFLPITSAIDGSFYSTNILQKMKIYPTDPVRIFPQKCSGFMTSVNPKLNEGHYIYPVIQ